MDKQKFTPGPWEVACGAVYVAPAGEYATNARIAKMDRDEPRTAPTERDANARLIAAAPDLLAACSGLINAAECIDSQECPPDTDDVQYLHDSIDKARAAIAKSGAGKK